MRANTDRLLDIVDAIGRVKRHTQGGRSTFESDERVQVWVVRHLQIIGEAAAKLPEDLLQGHPDVPWRSIINMRRVLVHDYFDVNLELVWSVVGNGIASVATFDRYAPADYAQRRGLRCREAVARSSG
jgi:uncharacterized protein with HEPN domain